jgi:hypothetical protein
MVWEFVIKRVAISNSTLWIGNIYGLIVIEIIVILVSFQLEKVEIRGECLGHRNHPKTK